MYQYKDEGGSTGSVSSNDRADFDDGSETSMDHLSDNNNNNRSMGNMPAMMPQAVSAK